ncbi:MAG: hypothetical protein A2181_02015 [Bdellovibrionales bacterium RIFOXYA1_FULL_38_20]|nr:MAG: hypothetical protein A2181_02015 [Bdellovibrionales bacterium RIFOXYA1_FULL_38_20]
MRKWTERRIAFVSLWISGLSFLIASGSGIWFSYKAQKLDERNFCFNYINSKLESIKTDVPDLPRLLSGCAVDPATYCGNARAAVTKIRNLVMALNDGLLESNAQFKDLDDALAAVKIYLKDTNNGNKDVLIEMGEKITSMLRAVDSVGMKKIKCLESL